MFKSYIVAIFISSNFVLGTERHVPEVHENIDEALVEVSRKARHFGEKYKPPVFIYGKTIQPDLRKWRYFQQQQADSKNMEKILKRLETANVFHNSGIQHRDRTQPISKVREFSMPMALEARWKIVHPKLVTEKQNDFSPDELIKMQEQYGTKHTQNLAVSETTTMKNNITDNPSKKPVKRDYSVEESDLAADASEITESQTSADKQDQSTIIFSSGFPPNPPAVYVPASSSVDTTAKTPISNHKSLDQTDLDALYSILGETQTAQIHGLKQLLHSQAVEVASVPISNSHNTHIPVTETQEAAPVQPSANDNEIQSAHIQNIIQVGGQSLEQIQAQLDVLSRKQGEQAIAEAHRKALEYVRSQQNAIEEAYAKQKALTVGTIKPHNFPLPESLTQNVPLIQPKPSIPNVPQNEVYAVISPQDETLHTYSYNPNSVQNIHPQSFITNNNDATKHSQLQAQAYLQLASQNYGTPSQQTSHLTTQNQIEYTSIHPDIINNGVTGINANKPVDSNVEHTQQEVETYEKLASSSYSQPTETVQNVYVSSENTNSEEQSADQHGHDNGYAPKYSFGYRVVDSHSGVDYGHQESRDGKLTTGRYHVLLPDGRLQSVNYWSDFRGYHAKVTYSSLAHH